MDPAREVFEEIRIWEPSPKPVPLEELLEGIEPEADRKFLTATYEITRDFYATQPRRKNGQEAFTHPTNVARYLRKARCQVGVVAAGLLHDVLEDRLDKRAVGLSDEPIFKDERANLGKLVVSIAKETGFPREIAERIVEVVSVLTRHKADLYYKSISGIFTHDDPLVQVNAACVKMADRMHNIQTIENYEGEDQLYQCFKNIFILNNAKQLLARVTGGVFDSRMAYSVEKLFKKCGKATFQALMRLDYEQDRPEVFQVCTVLALALRKYILEVRGLWKVTEYKLEPGVPVYYLYHGIIKKYDHKLHHEHKAFRRHVERELAYMRATFADLGLSDSDLLKADFYKDAIALREVVASLLYLEDYVIRGFECSALCRRNRNCLRAGEVGDGEV